MNPVLEASLSLLIPTLVVLHLFWSPFTKVEESFNIQATHDILLHGIPTNNVTEYLAQNYDHASFPGSVPRSFVGALMLAGLARPWVGLLTSPYHIQLLVRAILGLLNAFALLSFRSAIEKSFGKTAGVWYVILQASQFHIIYYASRTLPNMYAFFLSTLALRSFVTASCSPRSTPSASTHYRLCLYLLTLAGVIFRSELAILLGTITLYLLGLQRVSLVKTVIPAGVAGAIIALFCTVSIDSFFWQNFPLWPEWSGFYYNTIQGHSAEWGVSPWHFYFFNALPRLLLNPLTYLLFIPFAVFHPATRQHSLDLLIPLLSFIAIYSFLPHKEWRFIIYTIPGLTAVAAAGASWVWTRRAKSVFYRLISLSLVASVLASFAVSTALLGISSLNYPGGAALTRLREIAPLDEASFQVHLDNLACQTGVTHFVEKYPSANANAPWIYDKTENATLLLDPIFWTKFDYVLTESPGKIIGQWEVVDVIYGFGGVSIVKPGDESAPSSEPTAMNENGMETRDTISRLAALWNRLESVARESFTKGWWIKLKMEPRIKILASQPKQLVKGLYARSRS